jgi:hypothetical protein
MAVFMKDIFFDVACYSTFKDYSESWCKETRVELSLFLGQFIIASLCHSWKMFGVHSVDIACSVVLVPRKTIGRGNTLQRKLRESCRGMTPRSNRKIISCSRFPAPSLLRELSRCTSSQVVTVSCHVTQQEPSLTADRNTHPHIC